MAWRRSSLDPTLDPIAGKVIAAFEAAERAGLSAKGCYMAGVDAWHRAYPDQRREYAAMQAVAVILKAKVSLRIDD